MCNQQCHTYMTRGSERFKAL